MINTVCLCGSTRFMDDFKLANRELTCLGLSVLSIAFAAEKDVFGAEKEPAVKELLDLVHFNKILRSDAVFVVGDGYVGFSTAREILWADMQGKPILRQREFMIGKEIDWVEISLYLKKGRSDPNMLAAARSILKAHEKKS